MNYLSITLNLPPLKYIRKVLKLTEYALLMTAKSASGLLRRAKSFIWYSGASGATESNADVNMVLEGASNVGLAMLAPNKGSRVENRVWMCGRR